MKRWMAYLGVWVGFGLLTGFVPGHNPSSFSGKKRNLDCEQANSSFVKDKKNWRASGYTSGWYGFANSRNKDRNRELRMRCTRSFRRVYVSRRKGTSFDALCRSIGLVCKRVCDWEGRRKSCSDSPYRWGDGSRLAYCVRGRVQAWRRPRRSNQNGGVCWFPRQGCVKLVRRNTRRGRLYIKLKNMCRGRIYIKKCIEYRRKGHRRWDCGSTGVRQGRTTSWYSYNATGRFHIRYIGVRKPSKDWVCADKHSKWRLSGAAFQATNPPAVPSL
ncbi:MAG: hypothetical protein EP343_17975 [Deltaproteobacteria bacterium]|nr:MAG: hypothetical protein EP343_17975 [Deltaproteobacteria bacterium]